MRILREDALTQRDRLSYADVTRTKQAHHIDTTLVVSNELLHDIHADKTNDGNHIKIRRISGTSFDVIGSMIDDVETKDHIKEIVIVAGIRKMIEGIIY